MSGPSRRLPAGALPSGFISQQWLLVFDYVAHRVRRIEKHPRDGYVKIWLHDLTDGQQRYREIEWEEAVVLTPAKFANLTVVMSSSTRQGTALLTRSSCADTLVQPLSFHLALIRPFQGNLRFLWITSAFTLWTWNPSLRKHFRILSNEWMSII